MAKEADEDVVSADDLVGIGNLATLTFVAQASALLCSSFSILLRIPYFFLILSLESFWLWASGFLRHPAGPGEPLLPEGDGGRPKAPGKGLPSKAEEDDSSSAATEGRQCSESDPFSSLELYRGTLIHTRTEPVAHRFTYPVRMALFNLDRPPKWYFDSGTSSRHMSADRARALAGTNGPVFLLTNPVSAGYEQNPISVYYCYSKEAKVPSASQGSAIFDESGSAPSKEYSEAGACAGLPPRSSISSCIAEVTNTPWGDRVVFTFCPGQDEVAKPMHVSPFMDMESDWKVLSPPPSQTLQLTFKLAHPKLGSLFTALLRMTKCTEEVLGSSGVPMHREENGSRCKAARPGCSEDRISALAAHKFFWLMPHKVAFWIYWQALKLWWKGAPLFTNPKYTSGRDYRLCPLNREARKGTLGSTWVNRSRIEGLCPLPSARLDSAAFDLRGRGNGRLLMWQDSKEWPWGAVN